MRKGIIVYVAVLVILVVVAYLLYNPHTRSSPTTTTTISGSVGTNVTSTVGGGQSNQTTTVANTTTIYYASCISTKATVAIPNGNFSTGTYANWSATGPGFGSKPFNLTSANSDGAYYGAKWSGYNGTFAATTYTTGISLQAGNLTSDPFAVSELYLNFKLVSSQSAQLYVQVLKDGVPEITAHYNTYASPKNVQNPQSTFVNASIPLGTLLCKNVSIKLVAGVTGSSSNGKGYIAATGFYLSKTPATNATQPVNQTIVT
jgi:hypothetical protein